MSNNAAISPRSARKKLINLEADRIKKWLSESYKPAVALHSLFFIFDRRGVFFDTYFIRPSFENSESLIIKEKIRGDLLQNPDDHIKPLDVVKRKIRGTTLYHFAVYLGNKKVVHISTYSTLVGQKKAYEEKIENKVTRETHETDGWLREQIRQLSQKINDEDATSKKVKITPWEFFLRDKDKVTRYHSLVPFKKPKLIFEHIEKALKANFGEGKYGMIVNNCEHFAWLCTSGINFSEQWEEKAPSNLVGGTSKTKNFKKLNEEIKKNNELLENLDEYRKLDQGERETLNELRAYIEINQNKR
jgi:hypothetical protein